MNLTSQQDIVPNPIRRKILKYSILAGSLTNPILAALAKPMSTQAHIVIVGVGAAGTAMANRLRRQLSGNKITIIGARQQHIYQPGYTMIASGLWSSERVLSTTNEWLSEGINWVAKDIVSINADYRKLELVDGSNLSYDVLVVATGCQLNFNLIEGMNEQLVGKHGIGCVYSGPEGALQTSQQIDKFIKNGPGRGLFTLPKSFLKCAGAPLKMTFTTLSRLEENGNADSFDIQFMTAFPDRVFSVPYYNDFVVNRWAEQGVSVNYQRDLTGIDPISKLAYFTDLNGKVYKEEYDFIHIVPPMSASDAIRHSGLVWMDGPFSEDWLEVDQYTLQHRRYPNIFGIGDVVGIPLGKTAASVKLQAPVLERNIISFLNGSELTAKFNGYTSCPLITAIGKAVLAEFGYNNVLMPSFNFIDPTEESWAVWVMEEKMLQPAYNAMLLGKV
ncbi:NAD(P)/FAD-dependent oxidoreductase [Aeromonas salmonicida]|uniref:NAD(P)/FAD-dependent oxidoreductase n=1 Tax=Aeromonas salmonicida TaxID=645 RepID=UPI0039A5DD93